MHIRTGFPFTCLSNDNPLLNPTSLLEAHMAIKTMLHSQECESWIEPQFPPIGNDRQTEGNKCLHMEPARPATRVASR